MEQSGEETKKRGRRPGSGGAPLPLVALHQAGQLKRAEQALHVIRLQLVVQAGFLEDVGARFPLGEFLGQFFRGLVRFLQVIHDVLEPTRLPSDPALEGVFEGTAFAASVFLNTELGLKILNFFTQIVDTAADHKLHVVTLSHNENLHCDIWDFMRFFFLRISRKIEYSSCGSSNVTGLTC